MIINIVFKVEVLFFRSDRNGNRYMIANNDIFKKIGDLIKNLVEFGENNRLTDDYRINYLYDGKLDGFLHNLCDETKNKMMQELKLKLRGTTNQDEINHIKGQIYFLSSRNDCYLWGEKYTYDEFFKEKLWLRKILEDKLGIKLFQTDDEGFLVFPINRIVTYCPQKADYTYFIQNKTDLDILYSDISKVYDDSQKNLIQVDVLKDALEKMNTDSVIDFSITNFPVLKYIYNTARYIIRTEMVEKQETESDSSNTKKIIKYKKYWKAKTEEQKKDLATSTVIRIITIKRKSILKRLNSEKTDDIISYLYRCIKNAVSDEYKIMFTKTEDECDLGDCYDEPTENMIVSMDDCIDDVYSTKNDWYSRQPMVYGDLGQEDMKKLCNRVLTVFQSDTREVVRAKKVIRAFFIDGTQQEEIANELGLNISTIKKITCKEGLHNFGNLFGSAFRNEVNNNLLGFQVQSSHSYNDNSYADDLIDSTLQTPADIVRFAIMLGEELGVMDDNDKEEDSMRKDINQGVM